MGKLAPFFSIGKREDLTAEELLEIIEKMYIELAEAINMKPDLIVRDSDGLTSDSFLSLGSININSTTRKVEMLTQHIDSTTVGYTTLS